MAEVTIVEAAKASPVTKMKLPVEIFYLVRDELVIAGDSSTLAALASTCRVLNKICEPYLYKLNVNLSGPANEDYARRAAAEEADHGWGFGHTTTHPAAAIPLPAICWGAFTNSIGTMRKAIAQGAEVNARAYLGRLPNGVDTFGGFTNPVHLAALAGNDEALTFLLDHGASLDTSSKGLCRYVLNNVGPPPAAERDPEWTRLGLDPRPEWRSLHLALCHNKTSTAEMILQRAPLTMYTQHERNAEGYWVPSHGLELSAIHVMATFGHQSLLELVLGRMPAEGSNYLVNQPGNMRIGYPLHYAAFSPVSNVGTIKALVAFGAHVNASAPEAGQESVLLATLGEGHWEAAMALLDMGAAVYGHGEDSWSDGPEESLRHLITSAINARPKYEDAPGVTLWRESRTEVIRRIIGQAATKPGFHIRLLDEQYGTTPLLAATDCYRWTDDKPEEGRIDPLLLQLFLDLGVEVGAQDRRGKTALFYVVEYCRAFAKHYTRAPRLYMECVLVLLKNGASIDASIERAVAVQDMEPPYFRWMRGDQDVLEEGLVTPLGLAIDLAHGRGNKPREMGYYLLRAFFKFSRDLSASTADDINRALMRVENPLLTRRAER